VHQVGFIYKDFSCLAATYAFGLQVFKPTVRVSNIQTDLVWHATMCLNQKPETFPPCIPKGSKDKGSFITSLFTTLLQIHIISIN